MISPYILAVAAGWVVSQGAKYIIVVVRSGSLRHLRHFYISGNMPSAHSTSVVALASVIGLSEGFDSAIFGLAFLFALIVMYDAMMVRRSSGEQGEAIQKLIKEQKSKVAIPRAAKGHTPVEVAVGAILGALVGWVVFLATK